MATALAAAEAATGLCDLRGLQPSHPLPTFDRTGSRDGTPRGTRRRLPDDQVVAFLMLDRAV